VGKELEIRPGLVLPADELHVEAVRSGGPGGQNVNKVASKIVLRFSPGGSRALDDNQKQRIATRLAAHREQRRNLEDARGRLAELLAAALARPRRRVATKPTQGSKRRRLDSKRRRSDTKRGRGGGGVAD
jgi:ribosome-associated protein